MAIQDEDMELANKLADDYLVSTNARRRNSVSITVIRLIEGELYYATNTDKIRGYQRITEETITALVSPGEHVFWFAGAGVQSLDGIEFDTMAQAKLEEQPSPAIEYRLWKVSVPEFDVQDDELLKYDILYTKMDGEFVRLDPKLRIITK